MPVARSLAKPSSALESSGSSASDERSQLEQYLQNQLEEDIARIFDESIYSDLEVVCGKLKILTHSCILKARTQTFYHKLEAILHVNIGRKTFDEIYSFVSDVYTECNIKHQEREIINYLNDNLSLVKTTPAGSPKNHLDVKEDPEIYLTPNCEEKCIKKELSFSPSTELTKEYYALVPIDGNILDKELIEQDALSNAFETIIKSQVDDLNKDAIQCVKPTSLFLNSSHISKLKNHSNICDNADQLNCVEFHNRKVDVNNDKKNTKTSQVCINIQKSEVDKGFIIKQSTLSEVDKRLEPAYSLDSLITDEPSSSSDYLSATYPVSPPIGSSSGLSQSIVGANITKMENAVTIGDSGIENAGMVESINNHKDLTLDSLTDSTFHDLVNDESIHCHDSASTTLNKIKKEVTLDSSQQSPTFSISSGREFKERRVTDVCGTSSKEEKQRQNEEIVILESSSLSSETGSWESVFPPKLTAKDSCETSNTEIEADIQVKSTTSQVVNNICSSLVKKSPFKSTSCFIDAATLADEEEKNLTVYSDMDETQFLVTPDNVLLETNHSVSSAIKEDISPNDWSESNDNDDSLEQAAKEVPDAITKDLSPAIIKDSQVANNFKNIVAPKYAAEACDLIGFENKPYCNNTSKNLVMTSTPNNSIISLTSTSYKSYESQQCESEKTHTKRVEKPSCTTYNRSISHNVKPHNKSNYSENSPIISGGASIEDHLPQLGDSHSGSPTTRRKIENIPIVSGAYIPVKEEKLEKTEKSNKSLSNTAAWVVDMSSGLKSDSSESCYRLSNKHYDKTCESLRPGSQSNSSVENCKSRSSVDSDSSVKSTQKFFIDLSTLPDPLEIEQKDKNQDKNEKKNMFSMFIDIGEPSTAVRETPPRLSSSSIKKRNTNCSEKTNAKAEETFSLTFTESSDDEAFERLMAFCDNKELSITEDNRKIEAEQKIVNAVSCAHPNHKVKDSQENCIIDIAKDIESSKENKGDLFVKLSDLDKPVQKPESELVAPKKESDERMSRSIPDNDWRASSQISTTRSPIISSFHSENAPSLNRLFPHLKNEFSRSMPGSLSNSSRFPQELGVFASQGDIGEQSYDTSGMSSVQSSYRRSAVENTEYTDEISITSNINDCQSRLGQDLLRMFLEEIAPDVIVEVSGRRIMAHKCILSSRCQYFAGILSGGWVQSAGNVISLPPFSFGVVHFALCHIYSGMSTIPDSISIVELATIADMLGLEGLKEAIMFTLKEKYCHHFHKPCPVCTFGVLECFPLSSVYGLDDLYRKCLRWITKHFCIVWPTKAFATLPSELLDKCYQEHIVNLNTDNFMETVYGCGMILSSLQSSRWEEVVGRMCSRLVTAATHFAAQRLSSVMVAVGAPPPVPPPGHVPPARLAAAGARTLAECLASAIEWAKPDEACRAYEYLSVLRIHHRPHPDSPLYAHAERWRFQCEDALVRSAPRVVVTQAFKELPPELRKRLRELGCIAYDSQMANSPMSRKMNRQTKSLSSSTVRNVDLDRMRCCFVPYSPKPQPQLGSSDPLPYQNNRTNSVPPLVRTTRAQEQRAKYNSIKTSQPAAATGKAPRVAYEKTVSRYLDPKAPKEKPSPKKVTPKMSMSQAQGGRVRSTRSVTRKTCVTSSYSSLSGVGVTATHGKRPPMAASPAVSHCSLSANVISPATMTTRRPDADVSPAAMLATSASPTAPQSSLSAAMSPEVGSRPCTADPPTDSLSESYPANKYATYTKAKRTTKSSGQPTQSSKVHAAAAKPIKAKVTRIPVFLKQNSKSSNTANNTKEPQKKTATNNHLPTSQNSQNRANDRKITGSFLNATKSSAAKIVPKAVKDSLNNLRPIKETALKDDQNARSSPSPGKAALDRSGTFLKDEPTFGDKITDIDD